MSGTYLLDWAALAVSLFNTIILVWLALTVLLNAESRGWGVPLAGAGLLAGAAFFISHSAILGQDVRTLSTGLNFWWHFGWGPVIAAPFAWYVLMIWYSGFWSWPLSALRRRQLPWFVLTILLSLLLVGLMLFANPLPNLTQSATYDRSGVPSIGEIPLLILAYPLYILLCIGLALDSLLRPAPSGRLLGDLARRRARPWLVGATISLLVVSLLVSAALVWVVLAARQHPQLIDLFLNLAYSLTWMDLVIDSLVAVAMLFLGQAIAEYEIFTGKSIPRRGFLRQWYAAILLAGIASTFTAWSLSADLQPIFVVLIALLLMAVFYALADWRASREREQSIQSLRPFVASQRLFERVIAPDARLPGIEMDLSSSFTSLCRDVLAARQAVLLPYGPLAALTGSALGYPENPPPALPAVDQVIAQADSPKISYLPLDPHQFSGMLLAIPLWSERGLTGLLFLSEKADGGIYSQEEIEMARASSERLLDLQASLELSRRLVDISRQKLAEVQVLDHQTRRTLHDEVLPRLHAALLNLNNQLPTQPGGNDTLEILSDVHRRVSDLLHSLPPAAPPELERVGLVGALRQVIARELDGVFANVAWEIDPDAETRLSGMDALKTEVLYYAAREALRNAARHARPVDTPLDVTIRVNWKDGLRIEIEDNGVGIDPRAAAPDAPASTSRGHGLAIHSTLMAVVGGSLSVESAARKFTRVILVI